MNFPRTGEASESLHCRDLSDRTPDRKGSRMLIRRRTSSLSPRTSTRRFPGRNRSIFAFAITALLGLAMFLPGTASAGAWETNLVQLDNGTCVQNLQIGSDKNASSSARPSFWIMGDGP